MANKTAQMFEVRYHISSIGQMLVVRALNKPVVVQFHISMWDLILPELLTGQ